MKKQYKISGLDCAHCAAKIEEKISELEGISSCVLNFIAGKLTVELSGDADIIERQIKKTITSIEPGVKLMDNPNTETNKRIIRIAVSMVLFIAALLLKKYLGEFYIVKGISAALFPFIISYLIAGGDVLIKAVKNISRGAAFDENFLMAVATIGAFCVGEYAEGVAVILFYQIGEIFSVIRGKPFTDIYKGIDGYKSRYSADYQRRRGGYCAVRRGKNRRNGDCQGGREDTARRNS